MKSVFLFVLKAFAVVFHLNTVKVRCVDRNAAAFCRQRSTCHRTDGPNEMSTNDTEMLFRFNKSRRKLKASLFHSAWSNLTYCCQSDVSLHISMCHIYILPLVPIWLDQQRAFSNSFQLGIVYITFFMIKY